MCCFVKDYIECIHVADLENDDFEVLLVLLHRLRPRRFSRGVNYIIVGVVYHPPGRDNQALMSYIQSTVDSFLDPSPNAFIIL